MYEGPIYLSKSAKVDGGHSTAECQDYRVRI